MLIYYDFNNNHPCQQRPQICWSNFFRTQLLQILFNISNVFFIISMFRLFSWLFQSSSTLAFNLPVWRSRQLLVRTAAAQIMRKLNWLLHRLVVGNETTNNKNNKIIGKLMAGTIFVGTKINWQFHWNQNYVAIK